MVRTGAASLVVLILAFLGPSDSSAAVRATVTNEDIRDAILQVVNVVRATDDRLERHEYRERALGEQLKKGMISIDKRVKLLEPFKGTIIRLDERLAAVETILMQKDERERIQLQKTFDAVEDIQKNLPLIVDKLKSDIIDKLSEIKPTTAPSPAGTSKEDFDKLMAKIDKVANTIDSMEKDLSSLKVDNRNLKELNNKSSENLEKVKRQLDSSEVLLEKYENKLAEYNNRIPQLSTPNDWQTNFLQALEVQKSHVEELLADVKSMSGKINSIPSKTEVQTYHNVTLDHLEGLKDEAVHQADKTTNLLNPKIQELRKDIDDKHGETLKSINEMSENLENLSGSMAANLKKIELGVENLGKVEAVMVQTADSVLDTKRRVEYGVHQIIAEVQLAIKSGSKDVDSAISERFDTFEMSILDEESGALANLTSKIGEELDRVWRQIGIMHQQMSANADTLNKLQNQTDSYVTGSLTVMDNMKGKVGTITSRITEVDENLNYLLGKLSLVTQEFNQIKSGLGKALDEMRNTYKTVKDRVKQQQGAGPHKIDSSEVVPVA